MGCGASQGQVEILIPSPRRGAIVAESHEMVAWAAAYKQPLSAMPVLLTVASPTRSPRTNRSALGASPSLDRGSPRQPFEAPAPPLSKPPDATPLLKPYKALTEPDATSPRPDTDLDILKEQVQFRRMTQTRFLDLHADGLFQLFQGRLYVASARAMATKEVEDLFPHDEQRICVEDAKVASLSDAVATVQVVYEFLHAEKKQEMEAQAVVLWQRDEGVGKAASVAGLYLAMCTTRGKCRDLVLHVRQCLQCCTGCQFMAKQVKLTTCRHGEKAFHLPRDEASARWIHRYSRTNSIRPSTPRLVPANETHFVGAPSTSLTLSLEGTAPDG